MTNAGAEPTGEMTAIDLEAMLRSARTIAVVGISPRSERDSNRVARYLREHGYRIVPVNPGIDEVLGERCYPELAAVPSEVAIDIVDVFRRAEFVPEIVAQAIARGVGAVWLQLGIVDHVSAAAARRAGVAAVMDLCIKVEHARLLGRQG
jgi:predicted CoA-binding protein